jgi:Protein of unknown function (DUF551)
MMDWKPIETAPKDGTCVIVATETRIVGEAFFSRKWCWQDGDTMVAKPTHWMPLPAPPVQTGNKP